MSNPKGNPATLKQYTPKWKKGYTRTIRVPVVLADEILEYAHKLDNDTLTQVNHDDNSGKDLIESLPNNFQETLTQVIQALEQVCEAPSTSKFTKALKTRIQTEAIERLKALTQVN